MARSRRQPAQALAIYGSDYGYRDRSGTYQNGNDRYGNGRYDNRYPNNGSNRYGYNNEAYDNGYRDGLEKGREDALDRDSYDPVRHSWYRSGNRGYNSRYGTREAYKIDYRRAFLQGYDRGYNDGRRNYNNSGMGRWWPF